ncbi:hypothetical protein PIB30_016334 [Stylosanthes scabra]|uniref:Sulfotransferase n=1 Tax=Stylosanthes scabra TaxID=79078 RepID=A0ABU6S7L5_9FABA|nr:hypothetical protein [Stylosanthes scabra]
MSDGYDSCESINQRSFMILHGVPRSGFTCRARFLDQEGLDILYGPDPISAIGFWRSEQLPQTCEARYFRAEQVLCFVESVFPFHRVWVTRASLSGNFVVIERCFLFPYLPPEAFDPPVMWCYNFSKRLQPFLNHSHFSGNKFLSFSPYFSWGSVMVA